MTDRPDQVLPDSMDLESTVHELSPRLLRYVVTLTRDWSLAEEISQDVLTILVQRWRRTGPPSSIDGFVFTVARRRAARAAWRRRLLRPLEEARSLPATSRSQHELTVTREDLRRALELLSGLSRKETEAVALTTLGELSVAQAAAVLGIGESALKMRVLRARAKLKLGMEARNGTGWARSEPEGRLSDPAGIG